MYYVLWTENCKFKRNPAKLGSVAGQSQIVIVGETLKQQKNQ